MSSSLYEYRDTRYPVTGRESRLPLDSAPQGGELPRTAEVLSRGVHEGLHAGAQVHVQLRGRTVSSFALGHARYGVEMRRDTLLPWFCCVKPLFAIAFGQLWERGLVSPETRVAEVIPEFGKGGKDGLTFHQLLTHTAGLRPDPLYRSWDASRAENFARICRAPLPADARPGEQTYYSQFWAWFMLAEALERLDGRPYPTYLAQEILEPLGIEPRLRLDPAEYEAEQERLGLFWTVESGSPDLLYYVSRPGDFAVHQPGVVGVGTARDLSLIFESLLPDAPVRILGPQTAAAMTARHRVGQYDVHHGSYVGWGLGVLADGWYWGKSCSPRTFGHVGMNTSFVIADPEHGLAASVIVNGMTGTVPGVTRSRAIVAAVYQDLGLASARHRGAEITEVRPDEEPSWTELALHESRFWRLRLPEKP